MKLWPILIPIALGACAGSSSVTTTRAKERAYGDERQSVRRNGVRVAFALLTALAVSGCAGGGVTVSDTYCRDTFYWRTAAGDTEETRRQADLHNSRRLCKCAADCP